MAKFRIATPAGASFTVAGGGYGYEMEALAPIDANPATAHSRSPQGAFSVDVKSISNSFSSTSLYVWSYFPEVERAAVLIASTSVTISGHASLIVFWIAAAVCWA